MANPKGCEQVRQQGHHHFITTLKYKDTAGREWQEQTCKDKSQVPGCGQKRRVLSDN